MCLISETHFTKQFFIRFKGYKVSFTIHSEKEGSAVISKDDIHHFKESKFEAKDIQATVKRIKTQNCSSTVISFYVLQKLTSNLKDMNSFSKP